MKPDAIDWSLTTWEGARRRQNLEFLALPFRKKLEILEEMGKIAAVFSGDASGSRDRGRESKDSEDSG